MNQEIKRFPTNETKGYLVKKGESFIFRTISENGYLQDYDIIPNEISITINGYGYLDLIEYDGNKLHYSKEAYKFIFCS